MPKPILTDDILEGQRRERRMHPEGERPFGYQAPPREVVYPPVYPQMPPHQREAVDAQYDDYDFEDYYGPRYERVERNRQFRRKVNRILFWVIVLIILLVIAILRF